MLSVDQRSVQFPVQNDEKIGGPMVSVPNAHGVRCMSDWSKEVFVWPYLLFKTKKSFMVGGWWGGLM